MIGLLIILFLYDDGVLTHGHVKIIFRTVHTQCIGFETTCDLSTFEGIGMHGNEEVGFVAVSDIGTFLQGDKHIVLARIDDSHVGAIALNVFAKSQCHS